MNPFHLDFPPRPIVAPSARSFVVRSLARLTLAEVAGRTLDVTVSLLAVAASLPFLLVRGTWALWKCGRFFERSPLLGRGNHSFEDLRLAGKAPGAALGRLLNVLRGDMSLAGPRVLTEEQMRALPGRALVRQKVKPGVFSPFGLRSAVGIAYESEAEVDREYVLESSLRGDLGLVLRGLPSRFLGGRRVAAKLDPEIRILGVRIDNLVMDEALDRIVGAAARGCRMRISFVNSDCLNLACRDREYREATNESELVLPDGIGLRLGCRLLGTQLAGNVNGTDLFPRLCERAANLGLSLYLLGAREGVAAEAAERMKAAYPGLRIAGSHHGYFLPEEDGAVVERINRAQPDLVFVAMGAPRQEVWLRRNTPGLTAPVGLGVGGLFDFYSGRVRRAPVWCQEIGMEWLWRLLQEPGRLWRRYLVGNPLFILRVWRQQRSEKRASASRRVDCVASSRAPGAVS